MPWKHRQETLLAPSALFKAHPSRVPWSVRDGYLTTRTGLSKRGTLWGTCKGTKKGIVKGTCWLYSFERKNGFSQTMPKKHLRDDTDIAGLAKDLAGRWQPGDGVEPWLRSLEPELSRKVRDERWSWESIARAMNIAGILYQTARPWTGTSLLQKITSIRYEGRQHVRRKGDDLSKPPAARIPSPAPETPPQPHAASVLTESPSDEEDEGDGVIEEPKFQFVTLKRGVPAPKQPKPISTTPEQPAAKKATDEEILRRVFGKKS
jgi:hypothetical protein